MACQAFTAGETVSPPDVAQAQARRRAADEKRAGHEKHADREHHAAREHAAQPDHAEGAKQAPQPAAVETATASHILISYAGARRASPETKRTKEQAQKLAEQIAKKAHARGADFAALAKRYTEDPSGKTNGGKLGTFQRGRMVAEFDQATFALAPGETSGVIETAFGFHIIYREK